MKRSFVFVPAMLIVLFLLNTFFVLKGKDEKKKPVKVGKSSKIGNVLFKSVDGGQTWKDISEGLPEKLQREGVQSDGVFANDGGIYLRAGNGIYHSDPSSTTPVWTKEILPGKQRNIVPGKNGMLAYNFRGQFLKKINGTSDWSPRYTNFQEQAVRLNRTVDWMYTNYKEKQVSSIFETTRGTVFIGSNNALYKSTNSGKTWQYVHVGGWILKMVESNGVLLAASTKGILRSTDNGENWYPVISEGGEGVAVERIDGGFAAIAYNTITRTSTIHISLDNGKTWDDVGERFQPSLNMSLFKPIWGLQSSRYISSIKQVGGYLICGRSDGVFRSSDMGKTWKLLLPSIENMGFKLAVSGNAIYAIPSRGC